MSDARPRRLLAVSLADHVGGAERSMLTLLARLPARGWEPVLACLPGPLAEEARRVGVAVMETAWRPVRPVSDVRAGRKRYRVRALAAAASSTTRNVTTLARAARRTRADVLLSNSTLGHPSVVAAGMLARRPSVLHVRDIVTPGRGRTVLRACARRAAAVIAISDAVARTVQPVPAVVEANPVEVPDDVPRSRHAADPGLVGYVGRLDPEKGVDVLIAAVGAAGLRLRVAGESRFAPDGYRDDLARLADRAAPGLVTFLGEQPRPWELLGSVAMLAVPSREEPFGRVAAEAAMVGVPVVASASGGLVDVVVPDRTGLLVPPGDIPALTEALRRLATDDALRRRLGEGARELSARFDPDRHAERVAAVLDRAVRT